MLIPSKDREMLLLEGGGFAMIYGPDGRPLAEPLPETKGASSTPTSISA